MLSARVQEQNESIFRSSVILLKSVGHRKTRRGGLTADIDRTSRINLYSVAIIVIGAAEVRVEDLGAARREFSYQHVAVATFSGKSYACDIDIPRFIHGNRIPLIGSGTSQES